MAQRKLGRLPNVHARGNQNEFLLSLQVTQDLQ
jgi:hypothetical protein